MMRLAPLLAGVLLLCGCADRKTSGPRILRVSVAADQEFRNRSDWEKIIRSRFETIGPHWERQFGIRWEVAVVNAWVSQNGVDAQRLCAALRGGTSGPDAIMLGISGQPAPTDSLGFAAPFSSVLLVYDFPKAPESQNAAILSHQLAGLFGVWDSATRPTSLDFDPQAAEVIRLTRNVDFQAGIRGMDAALLKRLDSLYTATQGPPTGNPVQVARMRAGEDLIAARSPGAALEMLRQAAAADPNNPRLHTDIALALVAVNELPSAIQEFRQVVRLEPQSAPAHANLGSLLTRIGNWQEGNAEIRKAVELNPRDASLHFTLASALLHTPGQYDAAIAEIREGLRLDPQSPVGKAMLESAQRTRAGVPK